MGLFLNKKGAVPEIAGTQPAPQPMEQKTQEYPAPANQQAPVEFKNIPPKELPPVQEETMEQPISDPQPQLSTKFTPEENLPNLQPQEPTISSPLTSSSTPAITTELSMSGESSGDKPFFVRIDKYNETVESFKKIFDQVNKIEKIVESLELTKEEEEKEIDEWKKDINNVKNNLNKIDKEVFSKI